MARLAIVTTHPIQYNAPLFKKLAQTEGLAVKVFYTWGEGAINKFDPGFGKTVEWNIPLLEGYDYCFVKNIANDPGSHHFRGIDNPSLIKQVEHWQPSAILMYGWAFKSHLRLMRAFHSRLPVLFRGDSTFVDRRSLIRDYLRVLFLRWVYRHINVALYTGTQNRNYFQKLGLKDHQLVFMAHAIDNERFKKTSAESLANKLAWRAANNVKEDSLVFMFAGKFSVDKNVLLLLRAFCRAQLEKGHLFLVGSGVLEECLKKEFAEFKNITFLPFQNQEEMPQVLSMADVFVLPSKKNETWGLLINEAMACQKAILASSACGAAVDLVKPGINGFIFQNDDEKDLIQKLRWLASDKNKVEEMGKNSGALVEHWSYEQNCKVIRVLFDKMSKGAIEN